MQTELFGEVYRKEWENICQKLLRIKYKVEGYSEVPEKYGGDLGIEGFTHNGIFFQCYCPDQSDVYNSLYEHQRDKITQDINKLISNIVDINKLSGNLLISEWHFLTPTYDNKDLLSHCRKKENELKSQINQFLTPNFKIQIKTEHDFIPEAQFLISTNLQKIPLASDELTDDEIKNLLKTKNEIIEKIRIKLEKIHALNSNKKKLALSINEIFLQYERGQVELEKLRVNYPQYHIKIIKIKSILDSQIRNLSLLNEKPGGEFLREVLQDYNNKLITEYGNSFDMALIDCLTNEAISDWIVRCPLNFEA